MICPRCNGTGVEPGLFGDRNAPPACAFCAGKPPPEGQRVISGADIPFVAPIDKPKGRYLP